MATATISHSFDDDNNINLSLTSSDNRVTVSAQAQSDPGGPYQKSTSRKHYLITISGATINSASDVSITNVSSTSASGLATNARLRDVDRVSSTQIRVYFSAVGANSTQEDNSYVASFSVTWSASIDGGTVNVQEGPSSCPAPVAWSSLLPTCQSAPSTLNRTGGLRITASGSSVTLNLQNYANKLVTLRVVHQVSASWQQGFSFNAATTSDITVSGSPLGGNPYSKNSFNNSSITGNRTIYLYNADGGNYNYTFSHSSVPGPRPTRTNYERVCTTSTSTETSTNEDGDTVTTQVSTTTCVCNSFTETYTGAWPHCPVGVYISQNGGDEVRWVYGDGSGSTTSQIVTVTVVGVREVVPSEGILCIQGLKDRVWIADPASPSAVGNCINDYRLHSLRSQGRFRIPSSASSRSSFTDPVCFSIFRGVAGAKTPAEWGFE